MSRLILLILLTLPLSLSSQDRFLTFIEGWTGSYCYEYNAEYKALSLGLIDGGSPFHHYYISSTLTTTGETLNSFDYWLPGVETTTYWAGANIAHFINENQLLITGSVGNSSNDSLMGVVFLHNLLTNEFVQVFNYSTLESNESVFYCSKLSTNEELLIGALVDIDAQAYSRILKLNGQYEEQWHIDLDCGLFCRYFPQDVLELSNGQSAVLLRELDFNHPPGEERERALLVMLNTQGEELWRRYPGDDEGHRIWPGALLEVNNEILVSYTDPYYFDEFDEAQINYESTVYLESFTESGDTSWLQSLGEYLPNGLSEIDPGVFQHVTQMQFTTDSNILLSGNTGFHGLMVKVEPNGGFLWYRLHAPHTYEENSTSQRSRIYHVSPTNDGGFICAGQYESNPSDLYPQGIQTAIALKVDEYGCLEPGCHLTGQMEYSQQFIQLWPNPAQDQLYIQLDNTSQIAQLSISDLLGKSYPLAIPSFQSSGQYSLQLPELPAGLYILHLLSHDGQSYAQSFLIEK